MKDLSKMHSMFKGAFFEQDFVLQDTPPITIKAGAPSGGRTHTGRILSPLPLPLGYRGHAINLSR